jgi:hypothetical protein
MVSQAQIEFAQFYQELKAVSRRDITQGTKLATYKKSAKSILKADPASANTLLGLIACLEHDMAAMHAYHKKALEISESLFTLMYYAASLEKSCLWNESVKYALLALDRDPLSLKLLDTAIALAPLTGRFSLLKRLLAQWQEANNGVPHTYACHGEIIGEILSRNGLLEKDLKDVISTIGAALSETDLIVQKFNYELITEKRDAGFIHYRFVIPDQFVASYYEDLIAAKLDTVEFHPRVFDAFSFSVENSAVYQLYDCMERELEDSADTICVPDPEKMKMIEELVLGVEI